MEEEMELESVSKSELVDGKNRPTNQKKKKRQTKKKSNENLIRRFNLAFDTLNLVVWEYDIETGVIEWSDKVYEVYGYNAEGLSTIEKWSQIVNAKDLVLIREKFELASSTGEVQQIEFRINLPDRSIRYLNGSLFAERDTHGETLSYIGTNHDIIREVEYEEKLRLSNKRLNLAIDTISMVIWETNIEDGNIKWDGDVSKIYGCSIRKLSTFDKWSKFLYPEDLEEVSKKLDIATETREVQHVVFRITDAKKKLRHIEASIVAIFNEENELIKYAGTNKDITAERENDAILVKAKEDLLALNKTIIEERERLQYYFDTMPSIIVLIDMEGKVEMVNAAACDLYGYTKEEMIGTHFLKNYIPEKLFEETLNLFKKIMSGDIGEDKYVENWALCKDGSERLIAWKSSNIFDDSGKIIGGISSGDDITDKAKKEEQILLLKEFAETANEASNLDEVLYEALKCICDFTGWPLGHAHIPDSEDSKKLIPSKIWYKAEADSYEDFQKITTKTTFNYGEGFPGIAWEKQEAMWARNFEVKGGFKRIVEARKNHLSGGYALPVVVDGEVGVVLEFFFDEFSDNEVPKLDEFTESFRNQLEALIDRERFQEKLEEAKSVAEQANKAKSTFLANMSHEIRTPMNAILGHAQILKRNTEMNDEQKKSIDAINRSGRHLLGLINEVLNMAKIEMGKMELLYTTFSIDKLLKELVEMFQFDLEKKKLILTIEDSTILPEFVKSDENKIRQILINLLANAVKFTDEGSIHIRTNFKDQKIYFTISDTGIGIPEDKLVQIFQSFEQVGGKEERQGTGLGLSISKKMAILLDGDITVSSKLRKGSSFSFFFPYVAGDKSELIQNNLLKNIRQIKKGQQIKVLIVDDLVENRIVLEVFLSSLGFEVKSANDGKDGVELFKQWQPDVVLMDMVMPVMNGIEATERIRNTKMGKEIGIIAVSASAFDEEREEVLKKGANFFIKKPYKESELLDKIQECTGVEYEYANYDEDKNKILEMDDKSKLEVKLTPAMRSDFIEAVDEGDIERVEVLANEIRESNQKLYLIIMKSIEQMDLDAMQELFMIKE